MAFGFTEFKDRSFAFFDALATLLANSPLWLQDVLYAVFGCFVRLLYFLPFSHPRNVAVNWARQAGYENPRKLYYESAAGILRMLRWLEAIHRGSDQDRLPDFKISDHTRNSLDQRKGEGAILIMPHSSGSLLSVRELARSYDILMLVKEPKYEPRAARQRRYFQNLGCEILDVRRTDPAKVARTIFKALREGRFVVGTCDRIRSRPPNDLDYHKESDTVLCEVLGQEVGVVGWPARFAHKCKLPMIPLMPTNHPGRISLHLANPIQATGDINHDSQAWLDAIWQLFHTYPEHWMFAYDKKWARLLRAANHYD